MYEKLFTVFDSTFQRDLSYCEVICLKIDYFLIRAGIIVEAPAGSCRDYFLQW